MMFRNAGSRHGLRGSRTAMTAVLMASLMVLAGCSGIDTGLNPGPDVRKERGPLVVPPPGVLRGTAM